MTSTATRPAGNARARKSAAKAARTSKRRRRRDKKAFGYQAIVVSRRDPEGEVCERLTIRRANENDVIAGASLILQLVKDGVSLGWVVVDRAFNNVVDGFLEPLREAGVSVAFILKKTDCGFDGIYARGHLFIIDGWLYPDTLPKSLWYLPVPDVAASDEEKRTYHRNIDRRAQWALPRLQIIDAGCVKLGSPARYGSLLCADVHDLDTYDGPPREICPGGHRKGEGCLINTVRWDSSCAPRTFQLLIMGATQHRLVYNTRTAVERVIARIKTTSGVHFIKGRFRVRTLRRVGVLLGLAAVAANLTMAATTDQRMRRRRYRDNSKLRKLSTVGHSPPPRGRFPTPAPLKPIAPGRIRNGAAVDRSEQTLKSYATEPSSPPA